MLSEVEHTLDVPIASGDRRLTVSVQDSIAGFAADYLSTSTGTIQIMVPHGAPNSGAASGMRKQIRQVLTARGVPSNRIIETSYQRTRKQQCRTRADQLCGHHGHDQSLRRVA